MKWLVVVATVLTVLALPFTGRVLWVAYGPVGDDPVAQLRYLDAVDASTTGWLDAYPGQAWPCDTVVALAAATTADPEVAAPVVQRWLARTGDALDPATGLLAHQVDGAGRAVGGARGSSQAIIATFWPQLLVDPSAPSTTWASYTGTFVAGRLGVIGALEHADGSGTGDVDSGPLVLGLSASASAVTQAAARANGDTALADRLNRQIELIAFPWPTGDRRTYLFDQLPVAVAFFVWADTTPTGETTPSDGPRPAWWALAALPALPAVAAWVALALVTLRRRHDSPSGQGSSDGSAAPDRPREA